MDIETSLNIIRLLVGIIILGYACYTDVKTRRAANFLWLIMGGLGGILLVVQFFTIGFANIYELIFIPIMIGMMYLFFQLRLIFGGADAKALMAIAILVPLQPHISSFPLYWQFMPAPWVVFTNAILLFLFIPLSLFVYNLGHKQVRFPHSFVGYTMSIEKAKQKFVWPMERFVNGKPKLVFMHKEFNADEEIEQFEQKGYTSIWVTPKIPFMIPLLAGFVATFVIGDMLSTAISFIVSLFLG